MIQYNNIIKLRQNIQTHEVKLKAILTKQKTTTLKVLSTDQLLLDLQHVYNVSYNQVSNKDDDLDRFYFKTSISEQIIDQTFQLLQAYIIPIKELSIDMLHEVIEFKVPTL